MLYQGAASRLQRRQRRLALLDATTVQAGGKAASELYRKLED